MITINKLNKLRQSLQQVVCICSDMIGQCDTDKLFRSVNDLEIAESSCHIVPEDYYKFRYFDFEICLHYHLSHKMYYIVIETQNYKFIEDMDFKKIFNPTNCIKQEELKKFYLSDSVDFNYAKTLFLEVCKMAINVKLGVMF